MDCAVHELSCTEQLSVCITKYDWLCIAWNFCLLHKVWTCYIRAGEIGPAAPILAGPVFS